MGVKVYISTVAGSLEVSAPNLILVPSDASVVFVVGEEKAAANHYDLVGQEDRCGVHRRSCLGRGQAEDARSERGQQGHPPADLQRRSILRGEYT